MNHLFYYITYYYGHKINLTTRINLKIVLVNGEKGLVWVCFKKGLN